MLRLGSLFLTVCLALSATVLTAVFYFFFGVAGLEAMVLGLAAHTALTVLSSSLARSRDRADMSEKIAELSRTTAALARQVADIGRRLLALEATVAAATVRSPATSVLAEVERLKGRLEALVGSVATPASAQARAATGPGIASLSIAAPDHVARAKVADLGDRGAQPIKIALPAPDIVAEIWRTIEATRIELLLQPIVTLPRRKVRFYEAIPALGEVGVALSPAQVLGYAERAGLMPSLDAAVLLRCVQVMRRVLAKQREIALFCNISGALLVDRERFCQVFDLLHANRALAGGLVCEFSHETVRHLGARHHEGLDRLRALGFRFSVDALEDFRIDPTQLVRQGFGFAKVSASWLLDQPASASDVHPADLANRLARAGIDLIVEDIDCEANVIDLLDFDVRFGQGTLFAAPRPVRPELLASIVHSGGEPSADGPDARICHLTPPALAHPPGAVLPARDSVPLGRDAAHL
jgi:cyclic-di-GMP phosphodiesterase, flagellum assembly factor TipF